MWSPVALFLLAQALVPAQLVKAQQDLDTCASTFSSFKPLSTNPSALAICTQSYPRPAFTATVTETEYTIITASAKASTTVTISKVRTLTDTSYVTTTTTVDYQAQNRRVRRLVDLEPRAPSPAPIVQTTTSSSKTTTSSSTTKKTTTSSPTTKSTTSSSKTTSKSTTSSTTTIKSSKTTTSSTTGVSDKLFDSFTKATPGVQYSACKCITSRETISKTTTIVVPSTSTTTSTSTSYITNTSVKVTVTTSTSVATQQCPRETPNACNGKCINKQTDVRNCGSCGRYCGSRSDGVANICEAGSCASPRTCGRNSEYCGPSPSNKQCGCYKTAGSGLYACYKVAGNCSSKYCNTDADCGTGSACLADCADLGYAGQCTQSSQYDPCQVAASNSVVARSPEDIFGIMGAM